jgi:hypothetical protein
MLTFHPSVIDSVTQIPVTEVLLITVYERLLGHGIPLHALTILIAAFLT